VAPHRAGQPADVPHQRLRNQRIGAAAFDQPAAVVSWFGAVQAQDYDAAKWALGLRLRAPTADAIEEAVTAGAILRTHLLRPTWHFVTPADIRWLLALTGPRVDARNQPWYRSLELDSAALSRGIGILTKVLEGGNQATRAELASALHAGGIATDNPVRLACIVMHAELTGIICSGPRRGKQFTYMLLEERVPPSRRLERDEALAALVGRYFTSHGPATLRDFTWWSGLTMTDAKAGLEALRGQLVCESFDGKDYWRPASPSAPPSDPASAYLLPNFDEYMVAYADRTALVDAAHAEHLKARGGGLSNSIVLDCRVIGTWQRSTKQGTVHVTASPFAAMDEADEMAIRAAAEQYGRFLQLPVRLLAGAVAN
jgi:hypothetical protein